MAANASDVEHGRSAHPRRTRQKPWFLKETAINWWIQIAAMFLDFAFGVTAIVVAILFGVFTILAWVAGRNTVKQAQIANQISLLSFCVSTKASSQSFPSCSSVLANVNTTAVAGTIGLLRDLPIHHGLSLSAKIGIGVGVTGGLLLFVFAALFFIGAGAMTSPSFILAMISALKYLTESRVDRDHSASVRGEESSAAGQPQMCQTSHAEQLPQDPEEEI